MENTRPSRYFGLHYILLRFLGLGWWHHPDEGKTANFPGWYFYYAIATQVVWVAGFVGLETIDPFVGEKDLDRFMFSLSFVITHNLTLIKLYIFFFRNKEIQEIVRTIEIDLYDYYQNDEKNRSTVKISKIFTGLFLFFGWMTIGNSSVYGIAQDVRWKNLVSSINVTTNHPMRTLPQPIYIPWEYQTNTSYILTFALETIGLLWTGHIVMTIDTFIGSVILHMSAQFAILYEGVITAYDRAIFSLLKENGFASDLNTTHTTSTEINCDHESTLRLFLSEEELEKALNTTLFNCFRQHQLLINCVEKFSRIYSYGFMTQLLSSMAAICVVMVQVSQDASSFKSVRLVISLAFFFAMIVQLAIQCFTGNELTLQAERISDAVMQSKWERMPMRHRRLLLLMMMRSQRPLRLTAAGFSHMDTACFLSIMKAAYSYYAVLSQKQQ